MFPLDLLIAFVLVTGPADPPEVPPCPLWTIQGVALSLEIMDPREVRYVMSRPEDFACDLKLLRRRYQELATAPPACDAERFPSREMIGDLLAFNRQYRQRLQETIPYAPGDEWEIGEAVRECDLLYLAWDKARDTQCVFYYVTVRRNALASLRELIGPQLYYVGCMPPHVPVWRFRRMD
jgi:hypothetical protein